jgi:hypothetical protein
MQWQISPQYQNMPHAEYMQTDEGKRSQQAFSNWDNWMRSGTTQTGWGQPAQGAATTAMPTAQQSQGNPYGFPQGQGVSALDMTRYTPTAGASESYSTGTGAAPADMSIYSPGRAQPTQTQSQGSPYQTAPQAPNAPQPYQPRGGVQSGGLMADPEETRRYDEIMARNGVSRQDYADPRYQDYLSTLHQRMGDPVRNIEEFGRYKQTGQTPYQLPHPPANSAQPRPYGNDQYTPPRREPAILIDGRSQRGPAPDQQQNPFAGMQPGVYSPTGQFYDGNLAQGLSQAQRQRDAFVMQMNQATLPYQMANVFGSDLGAPSYDFQGMLGRANKMVEDGFYNPFTQYYNQDLADQMSRYAPPSMYQSDRGPRGGIYT